jgi:hypothetical protein
MKQKKQMSRVVNKVPMTEIMRQISWRPEELVWLEKEDKKLLNLPKILSKIKKISKLISKRKREKIKKTL